MTTGIMHKNLVKFDHAVFELCEQTDKHTNRHTGQSSRNHSQPLI